jgi:hypothetical protein
MAIKDWPGGVVTDIPVEPSGNYEDSAASGVWTLDQVANYVKQDLWPIPGNVNSGKYVEGVFSTYLYTGNSSTQTITNGIDLDGEGGLVWIKNRGVAAPHLIYDTLRGGTSYLLPSFTSAAQTSASFQISSFNQDGFGVSGSDSSINLSGNTYASWTFRKAEKFFDVVTYTGDGVAGREIAHNLGATPGCIIVKCTGAAGTNWSVWHASVGDNNVGFLNNTDAFAASSSFIQTASSTTFTVSNTADVNGIAANYGDYVAYLFASDAGGFGDDGSESIIKCGSYTGAGADLNINVGFEPQFVLIKSSSNATNWVMFDTMRGLPVDGNAKDLRPNLSDAEGDNSAIGITSTGFLARNGIDGQINANGYSYIYIAIRRPMKTPTAGTEVFSPVAITAATGTKITTDFPVDWQIVKDSRAGANAPYAMTRLTGVSTVGTDQNGGYLRTNSTAAEAVSNITRGWDNTGYKLAGAFGGNDSIYWNFKRATGFFDVVAYTGNGTVGNTIDHNLTVTPELIIMKKRSASGNWLALHDALPSSYLWLNLSNAADGLGGNWEASADDITFNTVLNNLGYNQNGSNFIAYLFATLAGVSKVGSYTGTAATLNVDCGFSAGARFILIKRTDSTGDWYVWDSARGIVAGNDPYLLLNSTAAEVTSTDYIDPLSSGFTVTSSAPAALNASGGSYIFLAIA